MNTTLQPRGGLVYLLRRLTVEQWDAIDNEYRDPNASALQPAVAMLTAIVVLTLLNFFGLSNHFIRWWGADVFGDHYEDLYAFAYWALSCFSGYLVIPALITLVVFRRSLRDFGLSPAGALRHAWIYVGLYAVVLPAVLFVSNEPHFLATYPFYEHAGRSLKDYLLFEGLYGLQFVGLEFFFRGFLLFALAPRLGALAIFVMVIPYGMIHFQKPFPESMGAIIAGIALGTLALRTRSVWLGIAIHFSVAVTMDLAALHHKGLLAGLLSR